MRGFDSHIGPWTGHHDYFDHTAMETGMWGLDMRRNFEVAYDLHGKYTTDVITDEAVKIIHERNSSKPLFLYVAHTAVHSSNPYSPLPAPDETVAKMRNVSNDYNRQKFAAMLHHLDVSVGAIVKALDKENMLNNSVIVFSTDNGGPAAGFNLNAASNYPLRGVKNTLWEGGVRGVGLIWSPILKSNNRLSKQLMHISDWFPTLLHIGGYDVNKLANIDGISMWDSLSNNEISPRNEILHNIDDIWGSSSLLMDKWKIVKGTNYDGKWDSWYGPEGERNISKYPINELLQSSTSIAIKKLKMMPSHDEIL
jgi:arylsulfatase B